MNSPLGYVLIAERPDGEGYDAYLAYLIASYFDGEGELLRIAVVPEARWKGLGQALVGRMLAEHPDARIWRLDVRAKNEAAVGLYRKNGFRIAAENPDVYRDPRDNGYLMIREADIEE